MKLSIKDKIGPRCIIKEDGQKIYDAIHESLKQGETVTLDFDGVTQFASPFFNFAIGQLLKDHQGGRPASSASHREAERNRETGR